MRRRAVLAALGGVTAGLAGCADGTAGTERPALRVGSPAFETGGRLPERFTCDGIGESPPLSVEAVPEPTGALAVVMEFDVQVITRTTVWSLWNVPPDTREIPAGLPRTETVPALGDARQGQDASAELGYRPPCPPRGRSYSFRLTVFALREPLDIPGGTSHADAIEAIQVGTLASTRLTADYRRAPRETVTP
jgi:hypothetical protein